MYGELLWSLCEDFVPALEVFMGVTLMFSFIRVLLFDK